MKWPKSEHSLKFGGKWVCSGNISNKDLKPKPRKKSIDVRMSRKVVWPVNLWCHFAGNTNLLEKFSPHLLTLLVVVNRLPSLIFFWSLTKILCDNFGQKVGGHWPTRPTCSYAYGKSNTLENATRSSETVVTPLPGSDLCQAGVKNLKYQNFTSNTK